MSASLPRTVAGLDALPGVGSYTASAVACFAYDERTAFADTNIRRVLEPLDARKDSAMFPPDENQR